MDRDDTYSLISVNAGDDEEIVIQTGVRRAAGGQAEAAGEPDGRGAALGDDGSDGGAVIEPEAESAEDEGAIGGVSESDRETPGESASPKPRYNETTKEDLDTVEPMSSTQKAVIACVLLFIVGFVIYYQFLR